MATITLSLRRLLAPPVLLALFLLADAAVVAAREPAFSLPALRQAWPGFLLITLSLLVIVAALLQLLHARTTINALRADKTQTLVTHGLFRYSRNPVYLGFAGLLCGAGIVIGSVVSVLLAALFMLLMTVLHIRVEEAQLRKTFGTAWAQYASRTRRWL